MKNAINYLKFDFNIVTKSIKFYALIQLIICFMIIFSGNYIFGMSYLVFSLVVLAGIPFSIQGNEKSTEMYYMFPAKVSSMVLGRFLYLVCVTLIMFLASGIIAAYLYRINIIKDFEIMAVFLNCVVCLIICFIQYPIYYKIGFQNGRILSTITYIIPAIIIFVLPHGNEYLNNKFHLGNNISIMIISLLIAVFIGGVSYLVSYEICKTKEL